MENIETKNNDLENTIENYLLINFSDFENKLEYVNLVLNYKESVKNIIENGNSNLENLYSKVEESEGKNKLKLYDLFLYVKNNSSQNSFVNV